MSHPAARCWSRVRDVNAVGGSYQIRMTNRSPRCKRFQPAARTAALQQRCTMFRQSLRQSVSPVFRSGLARPQLAARSYHTHCFWRPPRPPPHCCLRPHVPIQVTTALLQLYQSNCQCSHRSPSSRSFHSTQQVQGPPILGFLLVAFKVGSQLSCVRRLYLDFCYCFS